VPPVFGYDDDNSPFPSPLADKGDPNNNNNKPTMGKAPVPKLDLSKAKKIQELNAKKIGEQPQAQNNQPVDPKLYDKLQK
jgi:hypothetical protein